MLLTWGNAALSGTKLYAFSIPSCNVRLIRGNEENPTHYSINHISCIVCNSCYNDILINIPLMQNFLSISLMFSAV